MARTLDGLIASVAHNPARLVRSAVEMSHMAAFTDGGRPVDRTNWPITYISHYPHGGAIALALDLTLRERSGGSITLDDYMRAMWRVHGKPDGSRPGYVARPYTLDDAEARLAEVSGDAPFARDFFGRYIRGHEAADYGRLLQQAGFVLQPANRGRAWLGQIRLDDRADAVRVASAPFIGDPLYDAGLDVGDQIRAMDGRAMQSYADVARVLEQHKPGDRMTITFVNRTGVSQTATLTLAEDTTSELLTVERAGGTLTAEQRAFRQHWLN